jgi:hypothetical protein
MPYIPDSALDALLNDVQDDVETLHICSQEPADYTEAATTYTLGNKAAPTMAEPSERGGGGRESVVSAITDGDVTATGTATHWALVKDSATAKLQATGVLSAPQAVTNGNTFTLTQFAVGVPDAV